MHGKRMKIRLDQLAAQLKKPIAPIYLVSGDELLLVDEACDAIKASAAQAGFADRQVFTIEDNHFDVDSFQLHADNFSLFSNKKIVELRCILEKMPEKMAKTLLAYAQAPVADNCLLIRCGKLAAAQQNTAWFKAVLQAGVVLPVWPIEFSRLPSWIMARLKKYNLVCDDAGVRLLAQQGENNLFALAQAIEKLHILYGEGRLDTKQVAVILQDQAQFQLFDLVDPVLRGEKTRALNILMKLQAAHIEPALVLWLLTKEIRELVQGPPAAKSFSSFSEKKLQGAKQALQRYTVRQWESFLKEAFEIDQRIKGAQCGSVWEALQRWVLKLTQA